MNEMKKAMKTNGVFFFNEETTVEQMQAITNAYNSKDRVRVWYGKNGKSWDEENDITGKIGRSTGVTPCALLVHNNRSMGGGALLTDCVVKMVNTKTGRILYQHANFEQGNFKVESNKVLRDGELYANCVNEKKAQRLADFMNGKRNSK
jgi:hypothetical protein